MLYLLPFAYLLAYFSLNHYIKKYIAKKRYENTYFKVLSSVQGHFPVLLIKLWNIETGQEK